MHRLACSTLSVAAALAASVAHATTVNTPDHIVVVIEENHDADQLIGSPNAPYINSLAASGLNFTNAHGTDHDSQPNYLELFSGDNPGLKGVNSNGPGADADGYGGAVQQRFPTNPSQALQDKADNFSDNANNIPFSTPNLGAALLNSGHTFAGYSEGLDPAHPLAVQTNGSNGNRAYVQKHNPWAQWVGSGANQLPAGTNLPLTPFDTLSAANNFAALPNVSFVVPNEYNDMHDTVSIDGLYATAASKNTANPVDKNGKPVNDATTIQHGDAWLQQHLGAYKTWAEQHNSLLVTVWDENDYDYSDLNNIALFINGDSRLVKPGVNVNYVNHFDLLKTIEDQYGLPYAGLSATATTFHTNAFGALAPTPEPGSLVLIPLALVGLKLKKGRRA